MDAPPVSARDILRRLCAQMIDAREPLSDDAALVPCYFVVELGEALFSRLKPVEHEVRQEAIRQMQAVLDEENARHRKHQALRRLPGRLLGKGAVPEAAAGWLRMPRPLELYLVPRYDLPAEEFAILSMLAAPGPSQGEGLATVRVTRTDASGGTTTQRLDQAGLSDLLSTFHDARATQALQGALLPAGPTQRTPGTPSDSTPRPPSGRVYATLLYTDDRGRHAFEMVRREISLGRRVSAEERQRGEPDYAWIDVQVAAPASVSRDHLRIRYDEATGGFQVKDLSTNGTLLNGVRLPPSLDARRQDLDRWEPLPSPAALSLAGQVVVNFEAVA